MIPVKGRILAVDFGDVRTGIAVSDINQFLASGVGYVKCSGLEKIAISVAEEIKKHEPVAVVVGIPINMNGTYGPRAERAKEFVVALKEIITDIPIDMLDERMTTSQAHKILSETNINSKKRKQVIDSLAAELILQTYLDRLKYKRTQEV